MLDISAPFHEITPTNYKRAKRKMLCTCKSNIVLFLQVYREMSMGRQLEIPPIEEGIRKAMSDLTREMARTKTLIENTATTEASLDQKIERKQNELERSKNRLQTLQKVRPAFLDEYANLEKELHILYTQYVSRYRTMVYIENLVAEQERTENARAEIQQEAAKKLAEQMRLDEGKEEMSELNDENDPVTGSRLGNTDIGTIPEDERLRVKTAVKPNLRSNSRLFGGMQAESLNSDSTLSTSESDSEDILLNDEDLNDLAFTQTRKDMLAIKDEEEAISEEESQGGADEVVIPKRTLTRALSSRMRIDDLANNDDF